MTDPAVEAAKRAERSGPYAGCCKAYANAAAREALKPIRELHHSRPDLYAKTVQVCDSCLISWPCATARLIYTTEEMT